MASLQVKLLCAVLNILFGVSMAIKVDYPEPRCSKYEFEERVLEKLVRVEHQVILMGEQLQRYETRFQEQQGKLDVTQSTLIKTTDDKVGEKLQQFETRFQEQHDKLDVTQSTLIKTTEDKVGEKLQQFETRLERSLSDALEQQKKLNVTQSTLIKTTDDKVGEKLQQFETRFQEQHDKLDVTQSTLIKTTDDKVGEKLQQFETRLEKSLSDALEQQKKLDVTRSTAIKDDIEGEVRSNVSTTLVEVQRTMERLAKVNDADRERTNATLREYLEQITNYTKQKKVVAFKARNAVDTSPARGSLIRYNTVVVNIGGGYSTSTGYFTAPYTGLYSFTVHICTYAGKVLNVQIVAAGNIIGTTSQHDKTYTGFCSSGDGVAELKAGDQVWIKCRSVSSGEVIYQASDLAWNSFSGTLIHRTV